jgi:uncharacterized 2Fe-2S/4Fe-4S cluster protein (DUF4445 family)
VKHKTIEGSVQIDTTPTASVAVIACATVIEEMRSYLPPGVEIHALDFGLHVNPRELKRVLQETVNAVATGVNTTLLGYGLCSMAVVGLQATGCTLVVPRVDDCIAIFLGSDAAYRHQTSREPGTYYLTKGWIEAGDSPFEEYDRLDPSQAILLQELTAGAMDKAAAEMCGRIGAEPSHIVDAVVVGNTAMHHLFVGLPSEQLARAPYVPAITSALDIKARDLGLHFVPGACVHLLSNVAGYVGADHVAMLLAIEISQAHGVVLAIDIGTNTEVCLANHGRLTSLSCASGPAFEGAHIKHGMRAADGAIERLRLVGEKVEYQTIGGVPPVGLCGSGILDALAQLYQAGVLNASGRMGDHPRVRKLDDAHQSHGKCEFVLVGPVEGSDRSPAITFTQRDVRQLQLAKGAMRTGINVLLETNGLTADDIDQVIIAGAFGTYIDVSSAMSVGMLPRLPLDRFRQVGNAAGMGAKLALVSKSRRAEARTLAQRVGYVEMATNPQFAKTFAQAMYLG